MNCSSSHTATGVAVGIAIGVSLGSLMDNMPMGIAIGIAVRNPRAPALGASIMQLRGSSGWIVHTVLRLCVGKV